MWLTMTKVCQLVRNYINADLFQLDHNLYCMVYVNEIKLYVPFENKYLENVAIVLLIFLSMKFDQSIRTTIVTSGHKELFAST